MYKKTIYCANCGMQILPDKTSMFPITFFGKNGRVCASCWRKEVGTENLKKIMQKVRRQSIKIRRV